MVLLPPVKHKPPSDGQRKRLARWLAEWELDRALRKDEGVGFGSQPGEPKRTEPEAAPAPGQIRLLPPSMPGGNRRPVYLLVLTAEGKDGFVLVPFGRFTEPAVPGELLTGRKESFLRVLCLWNAIRLTSDSACRTWMAGAVDDKELAAALAVYHCEKNCAERPSGLSDRIGPPLGHPFDPRHVYIREETNLLREIIESEPTGKMPGCYTGPGEERRLPKAAESREPYGEQPQP